MYSLHRVVLCLNTLFPMVEPKGPQASAVEKEREKAPEIAIEQVTVISSGAEREPYRVVVLCVLATQRKHPRCTARALQLAACYFYFAS